MNQNNNHNSTPWAFIALMATLMSFVALTIDSMIPALQDIGRDLAVSHANDVQWVVSAVFLGMAFGLMLYGPLSDAWGRKAAIYLGMAVFLTGGLAALLAQSFEVMVLGRVLQGFGVASPRVVTLAMIRDRFKGEAMGKIMSFVMIFFVLVPALAPSLGQVILLIADWRAIFVFLLTVAVGSTLWLMVRQKETLAPEHRIKLSWVTFYRGIRETLCHRTSRTYMLASGLSSGGFVGYLSSSQQLLQEQYMLGKMFALAFGSLALVIGIASFANARWVDRVGMAALCLRSLIGMTLLSGAFLLVAFFYAGHPPLFLFLLYLAGTFFCFGILFSNFTALALEPLGHIAGVANSVIGAGQTLLSVVFGGVIGYCYNQTVMPLVLGFFLLGWLALVLVGYEAKVNASLEVNKR